MNRRTVVGSVVCAAAVGLLLNVSTAAAQDSSYDKSYGAKLTAGWQSNPVQQMIYDFSRPEVREAQVILKEQGYDPKTTDGVLWPWTRAALKRCQKDHGLAVTGNADTATLAHLRDMARGAASPATGR